MSTLEDPHAAETTRDRLLTAAASLLIERDTIDISLADLAARAGLNSALVKYYFGSKSGLLVALIRRDAERAVADMDKLLALDIPPTQKMRQHLRGIMNTYRRSPYMNGLLHALLHGPDEAVRAEVYRLLVAPVFNCQRQILQQGLAAGEFRAVNTRIFYLAAIGACDQFMQTQNVLRLSQNGADLESFQADYIDHVVHMVLASLRP